MALSKEADWLKERISCSMCLEVFDKPHTLTCLHTLCKPCLEGLDTVYEKQKQGLRCPVCRDFCEKVNVRHNFLIAELLELHKMLIEKKTACVCKQCKTAKPILRCIECKSDFCEACKKIHDGFEIMAGHHAISLEETEQGIKVDKHVFCSKHKDKMLEINCIPSRQAICVVCKAIDHDGHKCEGIDDTLNRILPEININKTIVGNYLDYMKPIVNEGKATISAAHESFEILEMEIKKLHKRLREVLDDDLSELLLMLGQMKKEDSPGPTTNVREVPETEILHMEHAIKWVNTAIESAGGVSLLQELQSGPEALMASLARDISTKQQNSQIELRAVNHELSRNMFVKNRQAFERNIIGSFDEYNSGLWPTKFVDFMEHTDPVDPGYPLQIEEVDTGIESNGMFRKVGEEIWIPNVGHPPMLKVYDLNGIYKRNINLPHVIQSPISLEYFPLQNSNGQRIVDVVLASSSGIFAITRNGQIQDILQRGKCSDLCVVSDEVYVLKCKSNKVYAFKFSGNKWEETKNIQLEIKSTYRPNFNNERWNTLQVVQNHLCVYDVRADELFICDIKGAITHTYGSHGDASDDDNQHFAKLCGWDNERALLLCDTNNRRIKFVNFHGISFTTPMKNLPYEPVFAQTTELNRFCVIDNKGKLHFYQY